MLNLKSYTGSQLQNFLAMLNQCETKGVTDIKFIREQIYNYIHDEQAFGKIEKNKLKRSVKELRSKQKLCPSCKQRVLTLVQNKENLQIFGCSKCRYSEIREKV